MQVFAGFSELVEKGDFYDKKFQNDKALDFYLPAEKLNPKDTDLLVKISRQYALRMSDLAKDSEKIASGKKALEYAERAVAIAPDQCYPNLSVAICLAKLTPFSSSKEQVEASRKIKDHADKAVKCDPKNDLAWQVLGRWNQSLSDLGFTKRALAKVVYGGLPEASYAEAVRCFEKAIALNPSRPVHILELGRTKAMVGDKNEAANLIEKGLAMPNKDKDDPESKARAKETLKSIS